MNSKQKAKGLGVYSNDVTRDLNRAAWKKNKKSIEWCERWRKACSADPTLPDRITFLEFKRRGGSVGTCSK